MELLVPSSFVNVQLCMANKTKQQESPGAGLDHIALLYNQDYHRGSTGCI